MGEVMNLKLIVPSKTNPRKAFNDASMKELTQSIKEKGVVYPILVRPLNPETRDKTHFEIVDGERRYRAAKELGLVSIPAQIKSMDDEETKEAQMISYEQDADIHPLEKAEALKRMFPKYPPFATDVIKLAGKLGKSVAYVEQQLKLLDLIDPAKKAFAGGRLGLDHAVQIARLQPLEQERCLTFMLKTWQQYAGGHGYENKLNPVIENFKLSESSDDAATVCSVKDLKDFIARRIHLDLNNAAFDKKDAVLIEKAGSCIDCPKRSGFNKDLFNDITKEDICTDPACFGAKQDAFAIRLKAQMKKDKKNMLRLPGICVSQMGIRAR